MNIYFQGKGTIILRLLFIFLMSSAFTSNANDNTVYTDRYRQAGHPSTTAEMFNNLSLDKDASIRKRVASNRKTPKIILLRLAKDAEQSVKIAVATNLSAGDDVYPILARDSMVAVRSVVARFEYVPVIALDILATDREVDIRIEVALNLNTTKIILKKLTHDSNDRVKTIAEQALQRIQDEK